MAGITAEHDAGQGWSAIARTLTAEGVPTPMGGTTWQPTTVRNAYLTPPGRPDHQSPSAHPHPGWGRGPAGATGG